MPSALAYQPPPPHELPRPMLMLMLRPIGTEPVPSLAFLKARATLFTSSRVVGIFRLSLSSQSWRAINTLALFAARSATGKAMILPPTLAYDQAALPSRYVSIGFLSQSALAEAFQASVMSASDLASSICTYVLCGRSSIQSGSWPLAMVRLYLLPRTPPTAVQAMRESILNSSMLIFHGRLVLGSSFTPVSPISTRLAPMMTMGSALAGVVTSGRIVSQPLLWSGEPGRTPRALSRSLTDAAAAAVGAVVAAAPAVGAAAVGAAAVGAAVGGALVVQAANMRPPAVTVPRRKKSRRLSFWVIICPPWMMRQNEPWTGLADEGHRSIGAFLSRARTARH